MKSHRTPYYNPIFQATRVRFVLYEHNHNFVLEECGVLHSAEWATMGRTWRTSHYRHIR